MSQRCLSGEDPLARGALDLLDILRPSKAAQLLPQFYLIRLGEDFSFAGGTLDGW
jgi:hypothetical protein